ncbi:Glutamyl-tRNA reductase [hydrothermal vent metagenome]|uniref:glutamyl-tRNA reductase n=1 Tax=hydrothermal vent metagenome TaxID=652676 RepID=A0A3B1BBM6_9ZZZZ
MTLLAFGINHKTAPVDIREKVAFPPDSINAALQDILSCTSVSEAAIVSTCNRTELYVGIDDQSDQSVLEWFRNYHNLSAKELDPYIFVHSENDAVQHVLRVASGLDSLVLGEPQILGQIKDAYQRASTAGAIGQQLNRLFQHTFSVAKQVRTETAIGASPVSVAFAAVSLSKQIFADVSKHTALLIGAGETIELVARHLHEQGIHKIIVANRTVERAQELAQLFSGEAIALADIPQRLIEADIVISSTASQLPILGKGAVERALKARKHRPIFMVDIAVPRDIEPEVSELNDVYLYTVDDLQEVIEEGRNSREEAAEQAEDIIENQVDHFMGWLRSLDAVDTIRAYRQQANQLRDEALQHAERQLASGKDPQQVMNELARTLTNKLIHQPSVQLNRAAYEGRNDLLLEANILFGLDPEDN